VLEFQQAKKGGVANPTTFRQKNSSHAFKNCRTFEPVSSDESVARGLIKSWFYCVTNLVERRIFTGLVYAR
jgi:hypothetical protein